MWMPVNCVPNTRISSGHIKCVCDIYVIYSHTMCVCDINIIIVTKYDLITYTVVAYTTHES